MITVQRTVTVDAPVADAFAFVADFGNLPAWDPGIAEARREGAEPVGPGTRYHVEAAFMGRRVPMTYVVERWEVNERVVLRGSAATMDAVDDIRFEPVDGRCRIHYRADFTLRGVLRLSQPLWRPILERVGDRAMEGLTSTSIPPSEP